MILDVGRERCEDDFVESLGLSVGLRIISCLELIIRIDDVADVYEELRWSLRSVVQEKCDWRSIVDNPVAGKELGNFGDQYFLYRNNFLHVFEAFSDH